MAEAYGGLGAVAAEAGISRESLYRALSPKGNPTLEVMTSEATDWMAWVTANGMLLQGAERRTRRRSQQPAAMTMAESDRIDAYSDIRSAVCPIST